MIITNSDTKAIPNILACSTWLFKFIKNIQFLDVAFLLLLYILIVGLDKGRNFTTRLFAVNALIAAIVIYHTVIQSISTIKKAQNHV